MKSSMFILMALCICLATKAQNLNQEINPEEGKKFLVGPITTERLSQPPYNDWYETNFNTYEVKDAIVGQFKVELQNYQILVFLGTWCGDSKREVPRFMKILETADFPSSNLKIVALDKRKGKYKQSPTGEEWGLQILRVPTFIFYKNGREVNRIIETPNTSLEEDILKIIKEQDYPPQKAKSLHFD